MSRNITINGKTFKPGQQGEATLNTYRLPTRTVIEIPVHVFRSKNEGPTILFLAGMHGDEVNGIEIIRNLLKGNYFNKLRSMELKNPVMIGFGIKDKSSFSKACSFANGAIIGTAFINILENVSLKEIPVRIRDFINSLK